MNKLTKAAIAGAAGIALLLGGAGSLAYWNVSGNAGAVDATAGDLTVTVTATTGWTAAITNWVPGDEATYAGTVTVKGTGDNFKGELTIDKTAMLAGTPSAFASALVITFTPNLTGANSSITETAVGSGIYKIPAAGTYTIPVTAKVTFPYGSATDNTTKGITQKADLSKLTFNVKQVR